MTEPTTASGRARAEFRRRLHAILDDRWPLAGKIIKAAEATWILAIEAEAIRDYLDSPEAEKALAAALTNTAYSGGIAAESDARAILAAWREELAK